MSRTNLIAFLDVRHFGMVAVVVLSALMSPTTAMGQNYTFGDWASNHGYSPSDTMPYEVDAGFSSPGIDSLNDVSEFDWTTTPTEILRLDNNEISSIESGDFSGLTNLTRLYLNENQITSIESGGFSGLTNLHTLWLYNNEISSIESGDFTGLTNLHMLWLTFNELSSIESGDFSELTNLTDLFLYWNQISSIESGDFSGLVSLASLNLWGNQLSSIESGDFSGLTKLRKLRLTNNQLSSIESGTFSGLTDLQKLWLDHNTALTELNLEAADFSHLTEFDVDGNVNVISVSLRNTVVNQMSLATLLDGGGLTPVGIGELDGITKMDLSGIDFIDITDLSPLYAMDDLTDLWLVDTQNLDASDLDLLLDNLATIEGTSIEGILHMTQADFDAFNTGGGGLLAAWDAELGHHVEYVGQSLLGDMNGDGEVNGLDVDPFVEVLLSGPYQQEADMNEDQVVNGLDVDPFVAAVVSGAQSVPEPSTLLLAIVALGVVSGWRKHAT